MTETAIPPTTTPSSSDSSGSESNNPAPAPDTTAPIITLNGAPTINLNVGDSYTESGATATDNTDASVAVVTSGSVDTATASTYTIHYNATDTAGNHATELTRTVIVTDTTTPPPLLEPTP